jgi:hypothetical protein
MGVSRVSIPSDHEVLIRLLEAYEASSEAEVEAGRAWYRTQRAGIAHLGLEYSIDRRRVAAIVAVLSPREPWAKNLAWAEEVCRTGSHGAHGLLANGRKAERLYEGEAPEDVLGGLKVTAFDRALCGDDEAVVVDTWMLVAVGWPDGASLTPKRYRAIATQLAEAARIAGIPAAEFQAVVWVHVRGGAS